MESIKASSKGLFFKKSIAPGRQDSYDFSALLLTVWRHKTGLLTWLLVCTTLAGIYVVCTPPEYTAYTQIVLETPKRPRLVLDADGDTVPMDSAQADSRIQVIKSERLLRFVFETLQLDKPNAETSDVGHEEPVQGDRETKAFLDFMDRVSARRIGLSYVLELSYRAKSPSEAAHMVNSITSAYIRDLVLSAPSDSEVMQRRIFTVSHDAEVLMAAVKAGTIPKSPIVGIDARVISSAIVPLHKSSPHTFLTLIFALLTGLTTDAAFVLFLQNRDRKIRSKLTAKRLFGPDLVGVVSYDQNYPAEAKGDMGSLLHALLSDDGHNRIGVTSWQNDLATSDVAQRIADQLADDHAVSLLTASPATLPPIKEQNRAGKLDRVDIDFERDGFGATQVAKIGRLHARGHVIVDLPSLDASAAAVAIGKALDGILLIVEQDVTTKDDLMIALDLLEAGSVTFLGFVFYVPSTSKTRTRSLFGRGLKAVPLASVIPPRRLIVPLLDLRGSHDAH